MWGRRSKGRRVRRARRFAGSSGFIPRFFRFFACPGRPPARPRVRPGIAAKSPPPAVPILYGID